MIGRGGRLMISPKDDGMFEPIYERLVLLLAGSALEAASHDLLVAAQEGGKQPDEGLIIGVVASRRAVSGSPRA